MKKLLHMIFVIVSLSVFSQTQNLNLEWEQNYGGSQAEFIFSSINTADGGYLLGGRTNSNNGDVQSGNQGYSDFWLVKINSIGTMEWEQTYGGSSLDILSSIIPTSDGGYLLSGSAGSNDGDIQSGYQGGGDFWVVKINSTGAIQWEKTYGGSSFDFLSSTLPTADGGYLLGGRTYSNDGDIQSGNHGDRDFWIVKINSTGIIEWEQTYGGSDLEWLISAISTTDGGYLLGGFTGSDDGDIQSGIHGDYDYWVVKINSTGNIEWEKTYGGSNNDLVRSIIVTDGGYLIGGFTESNNGDIQSWNHGGMDYWIVKINSLGTILWEQTYGGSLHDELTSILLNTDGDYLLCGITGSNDGDIQSGNHGDYDYWVVKIDSDGVIQREKTYGGSGLDQMSTSVFTSDGGCLLGGWSDSNDGDVQSGNHGDLDYWVVKIGGTVASKELSNENTKIYPIPVKDILFVDLEKTQPSVDKILLFNPTGKLVFSSEGTKIKSTIIEIPTLKYNSGLYNLILHTKQGVVQRKIVIMR